MNVYRQGEQREDFFSLLLIICPVAGCAGSWARLYCLKQLSPTCGPGMSVGMPYKHRRHYGQQAQARHLYVRMGGCHASIAAAVADNENLGTGTSGGMPGQLGF